MWITQGQELFKIHILTNIITTDNYLLTDLLKKIGVTPSVFLNAILKDEIEF